MALLFFIFFVGWLLVCAAIDFRWKLLPVEFMGAGILLFAVWHAVLLPYAAFDVLLAVVIGGGFFALQYFISRGRWIGSGDIWLGALLGAGLGWPRILVGLLATYVIGAVVALILLVFGKVQRKTRIPFAPFMAAGAIFALLFGSYFIHF